MLILEEGSRREGLLSWESGKGTLGLELPGQSGLRNTGEPRGPHFVPGHVPREALLHLCPVPHPLTTWAGETLPAHVTLLLSWVPVIQ